MRSNTQVKEKPQAAIIPCPRCINGQILAINNYVCFQCGHKEYPKVVMEEVKLRQSHPQLPQGRLPYRAAERIICPKCGKEVCLNNQAEGKVVRSHKDPATEGSFSRPWCDMSGVAIPQ